MATTIRESFDTYKSRLELTDRQEGVVASKRTTAIGVLAKKIALNPTTSSLVIGSWDRRTLTRYLGEGDVDVMVILDSSENRAWEKSSGSIKALDRFRSVLRAETIYKETSIRRDRNCITMQFAEFRLDLIPTFRCDGGYFKIPDSVRQRWIETDPSSFASLVTDLNKTMGGTFVPIIKMVKGWNREHGWPIRSFHLECLLYDHYKNYSRSHTYDSTLGAFFGKLPAYLRSSCHDPVRGERVDNYLNNNSLFESKRNIAIRKAKAAAKKSGEAIEAAQAGKEETAIRLWKGLMGEFFPTYG